MVAAAMPYYNASEDRRYLNASAPVLATYNGGLLGVVRRFGAPPPVNPVTMVPADEHVAHTHVFSIPDVSRPNTIDHWDYSPLFPDDLSVRMDGSTSQINGAGRFLLPHPTLPVLMGYYDSVQLYNFSRWDDTISLVMLPGYPASYPVQYTDTFGWIVPFRGQWTYQINSGYFTACTDPPPWWN